MAPPPVDHLVSFRLVSSGAVDTIHSACRGDDLIKALMCVWVRPNLAFPNSEEEE